MATRAATNATPEITNSPIVKSAHRGKWRFLAFFLILVYIILLFLRETFQSWETGHFEGIDEVYVINRPSLQSSERFSIARVPLYSSRILKSTNPLILFDRGPCFWVAQGAPVHDRTGGEYIWCKSILARLVRFGNEVFVTNSSKIAMDMSMIAHKNGHHAITISHWGWEEIGAGNFSNSCLPVPAIGKDCLIKMNFWGTDKPVEVWPGSLRRYLTVYPGANPDDNHNTPGTKESLGNRTLKTTRKLSRVTGNTASGFGDLFDHCGHENFKAADAMRDIHLNGDSALDLMIMDYILSGSHALGHKVRGAHPYQEKESFSRNYTSHFRASQYFIVFGKFGPVVQVGQISRTVRNSLLWNHLRNTGMKAIMLHCNETVFEALGVPTDYFLCLEKTSIFKKKPYYNLLINRAQFVLGLGVPLLSTTPFDALACNTSVILPDGQHNFLENHSDAVSQFYHADSAESLITAVNKALDSNRVFHTSGQIGYYISPPSYLLPFLSLRYSM
jgi:hypothetical protein